MSAHQLMLNSFPPSIFKARIPKDAGRLCFHRCLSVRGGGGRESEEVGPPPFSFSDPRSFQANGGTPVLSLVLGAGEEGSPPRIGPALPTLQPYGLKSECLLRILRYASCGFPHEDLLVDMRFLLSVNHLPWGSFLCC